MGAKTVSNLTLDDIFAELRKTESGPVLHERQPGEFTIREYAEVYDVGVSISTATAHIHSKLAAGVIEGCGFIKNPVNGAATRVYRLRPVV